MGVGICGIIMLYSHDSENKGKQQSFLPTFDCLLRVQAFAWGLYAKESLTSLVLEELERKL